MKQIYCYLFLILSLFAISSFADTSTSPSTISVKGAAKLYIPINQVILEIEVKARGKTAKLTEEKGYQLGLKLKKVFQKFGINNKSITKSSTNFNEDIQYENKKKISKFVFRLNYRVFLGNIKLIDAFREECIKAGAIYFNTLDLINNDRAKYERQVTKMAYRDAIEKAQVILQGSGLKLGVPITIHSNYIQDYHKSPTEGIGDGGDFERELLLQQQEFYISKTINVAFNIEREGI